MPATDKILATKLLVPCLGARMLKRPRLLQLMEGYQSRKATVIVAPAGFGKTVLLAQFAGQLAEPLVWYHLDHFDNDPAVFVQYLVAGIDRHLPGFCPEAAAMVSAKGDPEAVVRRVLTLVVNSLSYRAREGLVVILDNYHLIEEPLIHQFISSLLEYLPPRVHLVLAGRTPPPFSLTRLKVEGMLAEIGRQQLTFNREEIAQYLSAGGEAVAEETVQFLEHETGGWPAALRLAGAGLAGMVYPPRTGTHYSLPYRREIYHYLATEVLTNLPPQVQEFLEATSVLEVLTPALCDRFLERTDSGEILAFLESRDLFTLALQGMEETYRYHHLFREFLQSRLGERKKDLCRRAGECYLAVQSPQRAMEYFLEAADYDRALEVLGQVGGEALRRGRYQTLVRWLGAFPETLRTRPWFLLLRGALYVLETRLDEAEVLLEEARQAFQSAGDNEGLRQALLHQARLLRSRGDYRGGLKLLETILSEVSDLPVNQWYDIALEQSFILSLLGEFEPAVQLLRRALLQAEIAGEKRIAAQLAEKLGELYYVKGEYARAVEVHQRAEELVPEPERTTYSLRSSIAIIYRDWGDLDQALEYARDSIATKEKLGLVEALPYAYHQLAVILADLGRAAEAEEHFLQAIELSRHSGGESFYLALSLALYGRLLVMEMSRVDEGVKHLQEALDLSRGQSPFINAVCLEVAAPIFIFFGNKEEGLSMLYRAKEILESIGASTYLCFTLGKLSVFTLEQETALARQYAARCLELAAAEGYLQMFISRHSSLLPVVKLGLEMNLAPGFLEEIIARLGDRAREMLLELAHHEDAAVRGRIVPMLARLLDGEAERVLRDMLNDSDENVRDLALAAYAAKSKIEGDGPRRLTVVPRRPGAILEIRCLGPFQAFEHGAVDLEISWRTTKARDLLAYLVHHREKPVSREKILEDIWPEVDPDQSSAIFHTNLYQLRRALKAALGEHKIVKHGGGFYSLEKDSLSIDVDLFENLLNREDCREQDLEQAVSLYRGEYMEGLDYPWITAERERLQQLYLAALESLARRSLKNEDYSRAVSCLRAILQVNPLLEDIHLLLMEAYAGQGDRLAVMQQYQTLARILDRELGVAPGHKSRELYYRLCSGA